MIAVSKTMLETYLRVSLFLAIRRDVMENIAVEANPSKTIAKITLHHSMLDKPSHHPET